ncbi:MAG: sensor histidine kinase [Planctomycetota bacterium]|jgi:signal transduction histidine kinase
MRLRQKLFAAIIAAMGVTLLFLVLASVMSALEAQAEAVAVERRLTAAALREFRRVASSGSEGEIAQALANVREMLPVYSWTVVKGAQRVEGELVARKGGYSLYRSGIGARISSTRWLTGILLAVACGTALLLLVVYGLLLRLVLRPVEDLVAASRVLSSGTRPPRVAGEARSDEIGELVGAFNRMTAEVASSREDMKRSVEEAVAEREVAQKRLALEQRLSATGKLAAGVAHEIANPLGGMMNAARAVAKEEGLSERGREYVELVNDGLERVRTIVERMRTFVRPRPSVGPVDVAEAVKGALAFARHRMDDEGVTLEEEYPEGGARVSGDPGELQQIFLNLVMNALDALDALKGSPAGERRLTVRVAREGRSVIAEVADTGAGMTGEALAGAFDLFYSTKDEGGTGLGLAIAHRIVTDHGGEIDLDSSPGRGTTARVSLPIESGDTGGDEGAGAPAERGPES